MGTLAATRIQLRHSRREREETERAQWREKGAEIVAPLQALIDDAEPLALGIHLEVWKERWEALWERWSSQRELIAVFAAAHPSAEIGRICAQINHAVPQALSSAAWFLGGFLGPQGRVDGYDEAKESAEANHRKADALAKALLEEIRAFGQDA